MSCLINRNQDGKITSVMTKTGEPSKLFENIHANPFLGDAEFSAKIMSAVQNKVSTDTYDTAEPKMYYKADTDKLYEDLEDVYVDQKQGQLSYGYKNEKGVFTPVIAFDTKSSEVSTFLSEKIEDGVIEAKRKLLPNGNTVFVGKGQFPDTRRETAKIFEIDVQKAGLSGNVKTNYEGEITVKFPPKGGVFQLMDGTYAEIAPEEIPTRLKDIQDKAAALSLMYLSRKADTTIAQAEDLGLLGKSLTSFLQNLGFSTTTLESYKKRYNTLFGKDPDVRALTDIANRVVAFANGQVTSENVSEEVAHIALEAYYDQESILEQLMAVPLTDEYAMNAEYYRQKYSPFFEGAELEEQVRKEILGKILGKALQGRLTETKPEAITLAKALRDIFNTIMDFIKSKLTAQKVRQLNALNERIVDAIVTNDMSSFSNDISNSDKFFYSASSSRTKAVIDQLQSARTEFLRTKQYDSTVRFREDELRRLDEVQTMYEVLEGALLIVGIFDNKVAALNTAIRTVESGKAKSLSAEMLQSANDLKDVAVGRIAQIENDLRAALKEAPKEQKAELQKLFDEFQKIAQSSSEQLRNTIPMVEAQNVDAAMQVFDEAITNDPTIDEKDKEQLRKEYIANVDNSLKDISKLTQWIHFFGKSTNLASRFIYSRVEQMRTYVQVDFLQKSAGYLQNAVQKGLTKFDRTIIRQSKDGKLSKYLRHIWNWDAYYEAKEQKQNEIVSNITGTPIEQIVKERSKGKAIYDFLQGDEQITEYRKQLDEWDADNRIFRDTPEYRQKKKDKEAELGLSASTKNFLNNLSIRRSAVREHAINKVDGTVDYTLLSEAQKQELENIKNTQARKMNPFDVDSNYKDGITVVEKRNLTQEQKDLFTSKGIDLNSINDDYQMVVPKDVASLDALPTESRISFDLNLRAYSYQFPINKDEVKQSVQKFIDKLKAFNDPKKAWEWAKQNMTSTLSEKYYDAISGETSFAKDVEAYIRVMPDGLQKDINIRALNRWKKLNNERKALLKQNKKMHQILEVNFQNMSPETETRLKELESEISKVKKTISIPDSYISERKNQAERTLSPDFMKKAMEEGLASEQDLWRFAMKHMTVENHDMTREFHQQVTELMQGNRLKLSKFFGKVFLQMIKDGVIETDPSKTTAEEVINKATTAFASDRVASYMYTFTPKGYNQTIQALENGGLSIVDLFEGKVTEYEYEDGQKFDLEYMNFKPDYTWVETDDIENRVDSRYDTNGYHLQLSDKWFDKEGFFNHYGITEQEYISNGRDIFKLQATKNTEEFEHLINTLKLRKETFDINGETRSRNLALRPQITRSITESFSLRGVADLSKNKVSSVTQLLKEFATNRADEVMWGQEVAATDKAMRVVPKYFQNQLEDVNEVTTSTTSAVLLELREALLYKERVEANNDINVQLKHMESQNFEQSGTFSKKGKKKLIKGVATNQVAQAKEYQDHHIFGIQQSTRMTYEVFGREINLTKMIYGLQKIASFSNLGYSLFIPLTSATTGILNRTMYAAYQKDFSLKSMRWAELKSAKKSAEFVGSLGRLDSKAEMQIIFELLGLEDTKDRISDSSVSRGARLGAASGFLLDKMANLVLKPQVAYGVLRDYQIYQAEDGTFSFVNYRQYKSVETKRLQAENPNATQKEINKIIDLTWDQRADSNKYTLYDQLDFTGGKLSINNNSEFSMDKSKWDSLVKTTLRKAGVQAQDLVAKLDGVIPEYQRVAAQRNVFTNALLLHQGWLVVLLSRKLHKRGFNPESGQFEVGEWRATANFFTLLAKDLIKNRRLNFIENFNKTDNKAGIIRSGLEMIVAFTMVTILGGKVLEGDDDEEGDTFAEDLARLIYLRTTSEMVTQTVMGVPVALEERVKNPVPSFNYIEYVWNFTKYVQEETDEGENKAWAKLKKLTPYRRVGQLQNLQQQIDAFRYFNDPTLFSLGSVKTKAEREAEKAEAYNSGQMAYDNLRVN